VRAPWRRGDDLCFPLVQPRAPDSKGLPAPVNGAWRELGLLRHGAACPCVAGGQAEAWPVTEVAADTQRAGGRGGCCGFALCHCNHPVPLTPPRVKSFVCRSHSNSCQHRFAPLQFHVSHTPATKRTFCLYLSWQKRDCFIPMQSLSKHRYH